MKHPYSLPNIETIEDMFLELQDSGKFSLNSFNPDNPYLYKTYEVKTCDFDIDYYERNKLPVTCVSSSEFITHSLAKVQTKTFRVHQRVKRISIDIGKYWFTESNFLDQEKINISFTTKKDFNLSFGDYKEKLYEVIRNDIDLSDVVERIKDYLGDDLIDISKSQENIFIIDFNSYNYEITKIE